MADVLSARVRRGLAASDSERVPAEKRIEVGDDDARLFACNAVEVNGRVFMNGASEGLRRRLRAAGSSPS